MKKNIIIGILILLILAPRLTLLMNGLDSQRIWDTNTPAAFRFLQATQNHTLGQFFAADEKYPLLGSYLYVPAIAAYYGAHRMVGTYHSPSDFINAYALGETNVFFWIRLEMLTLNLVALWLLYLLTKKYTHDSVKAGIYALVFSTVDFFVTMFSVTPRIHSFAFFGTVLALWFSFRLVKEKLLKNILLAFGAAGVAGALSQSGLPTIVLPILAFFSTEGGLFTLSSRPSERHPQTDVKEWRDPSTPRLGGSVGMTKLFWLIAGFSVFVTLTLVLGYPRIIVAALDSHISLRNVFLSPEHSQPTFSPRNALRFAREYVVSAALPTAWILLAGCWYVWCCKKRERIQLDSYDWIAIAHILFFLLIFGFSDVMTGRFMLAILPSVFFLAARMAARLEQKRHVLYPLIIFLLLSALGIGELTGIAFAHDTRADAARFLLSRTSGGDAIVSTMDHEPLGITPLADSIRVGTSGPVGAGDMRIVEHDLIGAKSRNFIRWEPKASMISDEQLAKARYVVVSADHPDRFMAEDAMNRLGFHIVQTIYATRGQDARRKSSIPWDSVPETYLPFTFTLHNFRALGPTIEIFEK